MDMLTESPVKTESVRRFRLFRLLTYQQMPW